MKSKFSINYLFLLLVLFIFSCKESKKTEMKPPNILIAISDDQSFAHTSINGSKLIQTPVFDRIAREGILFTNCIAASPGCAPSRASLLTGRYPWQNEQAGQHASEYPKKYVPFPDLLEKAGYKIGYTGKGCDPFNWKIGGRTRNPAGPVFNDIKYTENDPDGPPANGIHKENYFANFKKFLKEKKDGQPFYFWYGAFEPHRSFEKGSGERLGKDIQSAKVPGFLPDTSVIRSDMADYAIEIEWFDKHLGKMLDYLKEIGELENTIVIVTSDNGMSFPRAKANGYEYGIHVPLAVSSPKLIPGKRVLDDLVSFTDFAPTILDLCGVTSKGMLPITGKSIKNLLTNADSTELKGREFVFSSRERHSSSRWHNLGYPVRSMRTNQFLLVKNFKPERWPAGAPQMLNKEGKLYPMYGEINPATGMYDYAFTDIDAAPSKDFLIEHHNDKKWGKYFDWAVAKRPEIELFDIKSDPMCLDNLATNPDYQAIKNELIKKMDSFLTKTGDPRLTGKNPDIFETYKRYSPIRDFPKPDWAK